MRANAFSALNLRAVSFTASGAASVYLATSIVGASSSPS
jgi:hypothetical protein